MKLDVKIKTYIPKNNEKDSFSHVYMHDPQEENLLETRGKLFSAIDVRTKNRDVDIESLVNEFLDNIELEYFSNDVSSIINILDKSVNIAYSKLSQKIIDMELSGNIDFNVGCFVIWGDIAYMARIGETKIYLFRDGKFMNLSDHLLAVGKSIVSTASGYAKNKDIFFMSTSLIKNYLDEKKIKDICNSSQEEISQMELGNKNISFIVMQIETTEEDIKDEELEKDEEVVVELNESSDNIENEEHIENIQKRSLNDFDLKNKAKKMTSYIINSTKNTSSNIYKNINTNVKKVDWNSLMKSILTVILTFFEWIFYSLVYLKDRSQKQYKLKINRDIEILRKEKKTVIGIIIFLILFILIYNFFF